MARAVTSLAGEVRAAGAPLEHLDLGGGLGVAYTPGQAVLSEEEYAEALLPFARPRTPDRRRSSSRAAGSWRRPA